MKKRLYSVLLVLAFFAGMMAGGVGFADNEAVNVWINGERLNSSPAPRLIDGRVFVPLRAVSESMGASVGWDGFTGTAYIATQRDALTDIEIVGDAAFKKAMRDALQLLKDKSPEDYAFVGMYVRKIVLDDVSLPELTQNDLIVRIPLNYKPDPIWWAHILVHEATHGKQIYLVKYMLREQREAEAGQKGLQALTKLKAPQWQINYVEEQLKTKWW